MTKTPTKRKPAPAKAGRSTSKAAYAKKGASSKAHRAASSSPTQVRTSSAGASAPSRATSTRKSPAQKAPAQKAPAQGARATKRASPELPVSKRAALSMYEKLILAHPDAHCELDHKNSFQLIVATVLSAQSTDVQVNRITPELFRRFPTAEKLALGKQEEVEEAINRIGMFRQKAKNLIGLAKRLVEEHGGKVPADQLALIQLPGVGRKTANVVLGVAFNAPAGVVVDTHVQRISQRLGWTVNTTPEKIEQDLMQLLPQSEWDRVSHTLIFHGRRICSARKPSCSTCPVNRSCVSAFHAEDVGRKPKKAPRAKE